jgi:hypothetical protein
VEMLWKLNDAGSKMMQVPNFGILVRVIGMMKSLHTHISSTCMCFVSFCGFSFETLVLYYLKCHS